MFYQLAMHTRSTQPTAYSESFEPKAARLFDRAYNSAHRLRLNKMLARDARSLLHLDVVMSGRHMRNRRQSGIQAVLLSKIKGSVDRETDFDHNFRPLSQSLAKRWLSVATALLRGIALPPIDLIRVGDQYFVKDGHHRISVAKALGIEFLDATVETWDLAAEEESA